MDKLHYPVIDLIATGKLLKNLRIKHHVKIQELTDYLHLSSARVIYKWQRGECLPSVDNLYALSRFYDISMNDLLAEAAPNNNDTSSMDTK